MNATRILVAQHSAITTLFEELAHERGRARARAVSRLAEELIAHMSAEESVFYPAARRVLEDEAPLGGAGRDAHLAMRMQLRRVLQATIGQPLFETSISGLRELFDRHVEEEETALFPRAEAALGHAALEVLGAAVLASRPPIWIVTTEGRELVQSADGWSLRGGVSLPTLG